jgi:hypothetical protein
MSIDYANSTMFWWILWDRARVRGDKAAMSRAAKQLRRLGVTVAVAMVRPALCRACPSAFPI